jgi:hypothetical protein
MSPATSWLEAVLAISKRWPDKDIFGGDTYPIWPNQEVPSWAKRSALHSWIFSCPRLSGPDQIIKDGSWFSGNHWWFRSRLLSDGRRFKDIWLTEPDFQLDAIAEGFSGVASKDAVAGHRIQPRLLQPEIALERARKTGRLYAALRLNPYRRTIRHATLLAAHPYLGRCFCLAKSAWWQLRYWISYAYPPRKSRFADQLIAVERKATYWELFTIANRFAVYSPWNRGRAQEDCCDARQ